MLVLGIETATKVASVGLVRDGERLAEESRLAVASHVEALLPLIVSVLARARVSLTEVSGIGVSLGPGSFTGLRVALSTAKGFAYALGQRVVGVSTLDALARTVTHWEGLLCPLLDARRGEVYGALFRRDLQGVPERLTSDLVLPPQELLRRVSEPCVFLGDGAETYKTLIEEQCGALAQVLPLATHPPCGTVVAEIAWERLCVGECANLATVVPRYVRPPEATLRRKD